MGINELSILHAILLTLNEIEVRGQNNLSALLGCINALDQLINQPKEDGEEVNNGR